MLLTSPGRFCPRTPGALKNSPPKQAKAAANRQNMGDCGMEMSLSFAGPPENCQRRPELNVTRCAKISYKTGQSRATKAENVLQAAKGPKTAVFFRCYRE